MNLLYCCGLALLLAGCAPEVKNPDGSPAEAFYTESSIGDGVRLPLLKPYEILRLTGETHWLMNCFNGLGSIDQVNKVAVVDSVMVLYAAGKIADKLRESYISEAWYVIIPAKKVELQFDHRKDFVAYLRTLHVDPARVRLYPIDSVFASFERKYPIDWVHDFRHLSGQ
ncbi:hypothetical protein [Hymenobacter terrenus]|uniref:hypothetical protein n=1 Tax=Hymenobacter terrenus TaxID=1629124 RepID=UPI000619422E|nr:hypothetical protein [Hymenobacter terrenus]